MAVDQDGDPTGNEDTNSRKVMFRRSTLKGSGLPINDAEQAASPMRSRRKSLSACMFSGVQRENSDSSKAPSSASGGEGKRRMSLFQPTESFLQHHEAMIHEPHSPHPASPGKSPRAGGESSYVCERTRELSSFGDVMNHDCLNKVDMLKGRNPDFVLHLKKGVETIVFEPGRDILKEGEIGDSMFILNRGEVDVIVQNTTVAHLCDGSVFGEMALLSSEPGACRRTATVRTTWFCDCRVITRAAFSESLRRFPAEREHFVHEASRRLAELEASGLTQQRKQAEKPHKRAENGRLTVGMTTASGRTVLPKLEMPMGERGSVKRTPRKNSSSRQSSKTVESRESIDDSDMQVFSGIAEEQPVPLKGVLEERSLAPSLPISSRPSTQGGGSPGSETSAVSPTSPIRKRPQLLSSISRCTLLLEAKMDSERADKKGSLSTGERSSLTFPLSPTLMEGDLEVSAGYAATTSITVNVGNAENGTASEAFEEAKATSSTAGSLAAASAPATLSRLSAPQPARSRGRAMSGSRSNCSSNSDLLGGYPLTMIRSDDLPPDLDLQLSRAQTIKVALYGGGYVPAPTSDMSGSNTRPATCPERARRGAPKRNCGASLRSSPRQRNSGKCSRAVDPFPIEAILKSVNALNTSRRFDVQF